MGARTQTHLIGFGTAGLLATTLLAGPTPIDVDVLLIEGDVLGAGVIDILNAPFITPNGMVGLNGSTTSAKGQDRFIWLSGGTTLFYSDVGPDVLTSGESTMGISSNGDYIWSPSTNGDDSVRRTGGELILQKGDANPDGEGFVVFCSRPHMTASGIGHFVSGISFSDPDGLTQARTLFRSSGGTVTSVLTSGDPIDGAFNVASPSGIDFDYHFSSDASHAIMILQIDSGSIFNDDVVYVDDEIVAREDDDIIDFTEQWARFDIVSINKSGDYIFTGRTNTAAAIDEFIAVNGAIVIREGDTIGQHMIPFGAAVRGAALSDTGLCVHAWGLGTNEVVYRGELRDLAGTSEVILRVGDMIDSDGSGLNLWEIVDLEANSAVGPAIGIADNGDVVVGLEVLDVNTAAQFEIIARIPRAATPCPADFDGDMQVDFNDLVTTLAAFGGPGPVGDVNLDGTVTFLDIVALLAAFGPCP